MEEKGQRGRASETGTHENLSKSLYFHRSSQNSPLLFSFTQMYSLGHVLKSLPSESWWRCRENNSIKRQCFLKAALTLQDKVSWESQSEQKEGFRVCPAKLLQHPPCLSSGGSAEQWLLRAAKQQAHRLVLNWIHIISAVVGVGLQVKSIELGQKETGKRMIFNYCHMSP